jgi:hypothetical protein
VVLFVDVALVAVVVVLTRDSDDVLFVGVLFVGVLFVDVLLVKLVDVLVVVELVNAVLFESA